jgi:acylphosphatase
MEHINITVIGLVQGVGFRNAARHQARYLGIRGYVKNLPDGTVWIEAEAEPHALAEFVKWCRQGPAFANVDELKVEKGDWKGFVGFDMR